MSRGWMDLQEEPGGLRYYVDGEPLHAGVGIEVQIGGRGPWIAGRYEYEIDHRARTLKPLFYHGPDNGPDQVHLLDPESDRIRVAS